MNTIHNNNTRGSTPVGTPPIAHSEAPSNTNVGVVALRALSRSQRQNGQRSLLTNAAVTSEPVKSGVRIEPYTIYENYFVPKTLKVSFNTDNPLEKNPLNLLVEECFFKEDEPVDNIKGTLPDLINHRITLSSHAYPLDLINSIPLNKRSKEFEGFIAKCKEIIGETTDPVTIKSMLRLEPEISLRVLVRSEDKATQYLAESYRAPYQPYLNKSERRQQEALNQPTKVSFAKKDLEGLNFIGLLPRPLFQRKLQKGGEIKENSNSHRYLINHTSNKVSQKQNYKPIFVKDHRTKQDALVLCTEGNLIYILKEDLENQKRMVIEKVDITENQNFILHDNQLPELDATQASEKTERLTQRTLALNLLTDSNFIQSGDLSDKYMSLPFYEGPGKQMDPADKITFLRETAQKANAVREGDQKFILPIEGGGGGSKEGTAPSSFNNGTESKGEVSSEEEGE
jgi:hypothetical protein